jgi:luciferase family oxidoreductase group 1
MNGEPLRLGILDFGIVLPGMTPAEVLRGSCEMIALAEAQGYARYWLVEHHESHYAWASPEVMLGVLGQRSSTIRIGSGAILLPLYAPLKVAELFRLLATLYPGRVDMGVCASVPMDPVAHQALTDGSPRAPEDYGRKLSELLAYVAGDFPPEHRFAAGATPCGPARPQPWAMGTGRGTMTLAAANGTALSYSLFHRSSGEDPALLAEYRDRFHPGALLGEPLTGIAVSVIVAETAIAAERQRERVTAELQGSMRVNVSGTPRDCAEQLTALAARYRTHEIVLHSLWEDPARRAASVALLADALHVPALT